MEGVTFASPRSVVRDDNAPMRYDEVGFVDWQRRRYGFGLPLWVALGGAGSGCESNFDPVVVAAHGWVGYESLFLARSLGFLAHQQGMLLSTKTAAESLAALRSGQAHAAGLALDEALIAHHDGLDLGIVLVMDVSLGADVVLARSGIETLSALKGLRLGLESSSVADILAHEMLHVAGLKRDQVQWVRLPVQRHIQAWQDGMVDALITYEPTASTLQSLGARRLFDTRSMPNTIVDVLVVRNDLLNSARQSAVRQLVRAHFQALNHLLYNPQDAAYRMAPRLHLKASQVLVALRGLFLPDLQANRRMLRLQEPVLLDAAKRVNQAMQAMGQTLAAERVADMLRPQFVNEVTV